MVCCKKLLGTLEKWNTQYRLRNYVDIHEHTMPFISYIPRKSVQFTYHCIYFNREEYSVLPCIRVDESLQQISKKIIIFTFYMK